MSPSAFISLAITALSLVQLVSAESIRALLVEHQDEFASFARMMAENDTHDDEHGDEHGDEDEDHDDKKKPWGLVIGFSILINLATLVGIVFLIPAFSRWTKTDTQKDAKTNSPQETVADSKKTGGDEKSADKSHFIDVFVPSFASGALLATSFFLVIPEALYLIQTHLTEAEEAEHADEGEEEHEEHEGELVPAAIWRFGASLLGGFMLPMLFDALFPRSKEHFDGDNCEHFDDENVAEQPKLEKKVNWSLVTSIIVGDAFHNFCDGIFVGVALTLCDRGTAYTIVGVTLYHEIAQELADYFLLTRHAGLKPLLALSLNFAAGLSVLLGGIVVLATPISDMFIGVVLSIAAGVYLYIAACECLPRVSAIVNTRGERLLSMLIFILGVVPIGLALLNHSHCEAEEHDEH